MVRGWSRIYWLWWWWWWLVNFNKINLKPKMNFLGFFCMYYQKEISLKPFERGFHLISDVIKKSINPWTNDIETGLLHIFIKHTSASITINNTSWNIYTTLWQTRNIKTHRRNIDTNPETSMGIDEKQWNRITIYESSSNVWKTHDKSMSNRES